jgi:hypothetical protein
MPTREQLIAMLSAKSGEQRLSAMTGLCNMVENQQTLIGSIDLLLIPVFDALAVEKERKNFVLGCREMAHAAIAWNFGPAAVLMEYCRGSRKLQEAFVTVLSFLQDRLSVQEQYKFEDLLEQIFSEGPHAKSPGDSFEDLWFEVLSLSVRRDMIAGSGKDIKFKFQECGINFETDSLFIKPWEELVGLLDVKSLSLRRKFWRIRNHAVQSATLTREQFISLASEPHRSTRIRLSINPGCPDYLCKRLFAELEKVKTGASPGDWEAMWCRKVPDRLHWIPSVADTTYITWEDDSDLREFLLARVMS